MEHNTPPIMEDDEAIFDLLELSDEDCTGCETPPLIDNNSFPRQYPVQQNDLCFPLVILDADLAIRWRNEKFRAFREIKGLEYCGRPLHALFSTFAERSAREEFVAMLHSPESGYGWQGPVMGRGLGNRQFVAHMSVFPLEFSCENRPKWYLAVMADLTEPYKSAIKSNFDTILRASLLKDEDTGHHVKRVNFYSRIIASRMKGQIQWLGVDDDYIEDIGLLAAFHDVGKIGTPERILLKNGALSAEEWVLMREHPINGALILDAHPNSMVKEIARSHHERWDGTGYPYGLAGNDIPLCGRIVAIADVYDALRNKRPYKEPVSEEEAYHIIVAESGSHFDPDLVDVFREIRDEFDGVFTANCD